jgi:hypothetical protein
MTSDVDTLLQMPDPLERRLAFRSPDCSVHQIWRGLQDPDPGVVRSAVAHPNVNRAQLDYALKERQDAHVNSVILENADRLPALGPDHLFKIASDPSVPELQERALEHPKLGSFHSKQFLLDQLSDTPGPDADRLSYFAARNPSFTADDIRDVFKGFTLRHQAVGLGDELDETGRNAMRRPRG